jgi:hypothetical protein
MAVELIRAANILSFVAIGSFVGRNHTKLESFVTGSAQTRVSASFAIWGTVEAIIVEHTGEGFIHVLSIAGIAS